MKFHEKPYSLWEFTLFRRVQCYIPRGNSVLLIKTGHTIKTTHFLGHQNVRKHNTFEKVRKCVRISIPDGNLMFLRRLDVKFPAGIDLATRKSTDVEIVPPLSCQVLFSLS